MKSLSGVLLILILFAISGCEAGTQQIIPTRQPTVTRTPLPSPSPTIDRISTATPTETRLPATGGPSPTPLFAASPTPRRVTPSATPVVSNPNAPRIEFFTSDVLSVPPGGDVTLYWSVRGVDSAVIYRLGEDDVRENVWNVPPDSSLTVSTRSDDKIELRFLLVISQGSFYREEKLNIPIECIYEWFYSPSPEECPDEGAQESNIIDQHFERGRMLFVEGENRVYVLYNDGNEPAWQSFTNQYDPEVHPERADMAPPGGIEPIRELGLIWRSNERVRNRLGLGSSDPQTFVGFSQEATPRGSRNADLFISSADGNVLQLVSGGNVWQIISP